MATIEQGQAKWERKMSNAGEKWKASVSGKSAALAEGLRNAGFSPGPQFLASWQAGVDGTSAQDFQSNVSGKGAKWAANTQAGISR